MNKHLVLPVMLLLLFAVVAIAYAATSSSRSGVVSASGEIILSSDPDSRRNAILTQETDLAGKTGNARLGGREGPSVTAHGKGTFLSGPRCTDYPLIDRLCIDDGIVVSAHAFFDANNVFAVSYTAPLYPAVIESVQVYILSEGDPFWPWPDAVHQPFVISIFESSGGQPGAEVFRDTVIADSIAPSWVMAYPNVVVDTGAFWVGAEMLDTFPVCEGMGVDASYDNGPQCWQRVGGVWSQSPFLVGDLMMCAFVSTLLDTSRVIHSGNSIIPPVIDGVIDWAEWADATERDVSDVLGILDGANPYGSAWLYVKNDEQNVYLALEGFIDTSSSDWDDLSPYFDDNNDGQWPASPDTNEGNYWFSNQIAGDLVYWRYFQDGPMAGSPRVVDLPVGVDILSGYQQFEGAIPFGDLPEELQALPGDTVGFFVLAYKENGTDHYAWWPYDAPLFYDPANYGDLILAPGFGPFLILAEASDNLDSIPGIDPDDFVLLEFDEPTNKPAITWSNIDAVLQLSAGHTWLDGFSNIGGAVWNGPGTQLMITLSTTSGPPTVAVGDTITPDGVTVTDALGNPCTSPIELTGSFGEPIGVEEKKPRFVNPKMFALSQGSPNPFCNETMIEYTIPSRSTVNLSVYDLTGRLVRVLVQDELDTGSHSASWDGRDEGGSSVPAGVYLYRLMAAESVSTRKLVLIR